MEKQAAEAVANSGWILPLALSIVLGVLAMWNVLFIFVIRQMNGRINKVEDGADGKAATLRMEMLPRTECALLSGGIAAQIQKLTEAIDTIHRRIDAFMHHTCEHCAKEVDKEETQGGP